MEMMAVLNDAMRINPNDSRAPYYLGNLLFDWQPQQAQALWEKSTSLGADFPVVYRNLAMVYTRQGNQRDKAQSALEKAVQFGGNAMVFNDLDKLYEENGVSAAKRLALMESHQAVIDRDDVIAREINLEILAGKPDAAIQLLQSRFFRAWEGGGSFSLGDSWINANIERGHLHMAAKQYAQALTDFQAALNIPANLDEATRNAGDRKGEISYWIGSAFQAMGDSEKARQSWTEAAKAPPTPERGDGGSGYTGHFNNGSMGGLSAGVRVEQATLYYQALALERLGQSDRAKAIFTQLIDTADKAIAGSADMKTPIQANAPATQRAQIADAHYIAGLGQLGLHNQDQARQEFLLALKASPDHYAATRALNAMTP
jgi:tetratricopeptide (TPR) repeat protein